MNLKNIEEKIKTLNSRLYVQKLEYGLEIRMKLKKHYIIIATIIDNNIISQMTDSYSQYIEDNFEMNLFKVLEEYLWIN